jgi:hypothetical protein
VISNQNRAERGRLPKAARRVRPEGRIKSVIRERDGEIWRKCWGLMWMVHREGRRPRRPEPGRAPEMTVEKSIDVAAFMGAANASQGDETSPLPAPSGAALRATCGWLFDFVYLRFAPVRSARLPAPSGAVAALRRAHPAGPAGAGAMSLRSILRATYAWLSCSARFRLHSSLPPLPDTFLRTWLHSASPAAPLTTDY